jgi:hypothetical protein
MSLRITEVRQLLELVLWYTDSGELEVSYEDVLHAARSYGAIHQPDESLSLASALQVIYTMVRNHEKVLEAGLPPQLIPPAHGVGELRRVERGDGLLGPGYPEQLPGEQRADRGSDGRTYDREDQPGYIRDRADR